MVRRHRNGPGPMRLMGLAVLAASASACFDTAAPDPVILEVVSGDAQEAEVGTSVAEALRVRATDLDGQPRQGVPVEWRVVAGDGSVEPVHPVTDDEGMAEARWTLGHAAGAQRVEASANGGLATFEALAAPPPPADWLDVMEVQAVADVVDREEGEFLQIGTRLVNHWGGTLHVRTATSCLIRMEVYGPGGGLFQSWGGGCWAAVTTRKIPPGDSLLHAVHLQTASLDPGTYSIDVSFHRVVMNDGRAIEIPGFKAEAVVE